MGSRELPARHVTLNRWVCAGTFSMSGWGDSPLSLVSVCLPSRRRPLTLTQDAGTELSGCSQCPATHNLLTGPLGEGRRPEKEMTGSHFRGCVLRHSGQTCPGTSARQDASGHKGAASFTDSPEMRVGVGSVAAPISLNRKSMTGLWASRAWKSPRPSEGVPWPGVGGGRAGGTSRQEPCFHGPDWPLAGLESSSLREECRQPIHRWHVFWPLRS